MNLDSPDYRFAVEGNKNGIKPHKTFNKCLVFALNMLFVAEVYFFRPPDGELDTTRHHWRWHWSGRTSIRDDWCCQRGRILSRHGPTTLLHHSSFCFVLFYSFIVIDRSSFPWVIINRKPTEGEKTDKKIYVCIESLIHFIALVLEAI